MMRSWGFMDPWCAALKRHLCFDQLDRKEGVWESQACSLQVPLPQRSFFDSEAAFLDTFRMVMEALALLAAVGEINYEVWRLMLTECCGVRIGQPGEPTFEQKLEIRYLIILDLKPKGSNLDTFDLVRLCGVQHRRNPSPAYLKTLEMIAAQIGGDGKALDVQVPVRVYLTTNVEMNSEDPVKQLETVGRAEQILREDWRLYKLRNEQHEVPSGSIRCTFVLEPMVADFTDFQISSEFAEVMDKLMQSNVRFNRIQALDMDLHSKIAADGRVSKLTLGELVRCLFATSRRKQAYTIYNSERQESKVDQIRSLSLYCESTLRTLGFEAVCSAVVVCQTTTELHLRLNMDPNIVDTQHWWMWIAYVFFSKRARTSSSIQKLRLSGLHNMCTADMKGFLAVVVSRHPEELLIGCPRGKIDERNATLKGRSRIRWQGEARAQPTNGYRDLSFSQALPFVRTFSDNGESTWVDVLIPGYGRCQVQRKDLEFETPSLGRREGGIKSLSIEFYKGTTPDSTGLPMFINAVGSQLTTLSIEGPRMQLDENEILRSCLNLEELTLCGRLADVKLDFREYRANKEPIPTLNCHWDNLRALSMDISDAANPLTKMVGRLRVRLDNRFGHWNSGSFNPDTFAGDVNALVNMLATNRYLEYSEIYVPTAKHNEVIDQFREYHLKPIAKPSKLPLEIKVGFLSVMSARTPTAKKTRNSSLLLGAGGCEVNSRIGSTIFSLAAPPVLRQVYCRSESDMWSFPWLQ